MLLIYIKFELARKENMKKILERTLSGENVVGEVDDSAESSPGNRSFCDLLKQIGMNTYDAIGELAQVLKVPIAELRDCADGGLVEFQAADNILCYSRSCRISDSGIAFLKRQSGAAGEKNVDINPDHFDFKDNCG